MKTAVYLNFVILFLFSVVGCGPSEQAIQEALAQTQTALATDTFTPEPTSTYTPEPTSTSTSTPTFTSTPDLRVITVDSKDFMLEKDDLPPEAKYYLPNSSWISPHRNSEIVSSWGVEEGAKYLEATGRIDGWWVYYQRGTNTVRAPEQVFHNIIQYKTAEGAFLSRTVYGSRINNPDYELVKSDVVIGDGTIIYRRKVMESSGEYSVSYIVETSYRNYVSIIGGSGWEKQFDLDYVILLAEIAMEKLKEAPLGTW